MSIEMTEDESALLTSVDRFIAKEMKPSIGDYVREHQFSTPIVKVFAEAGFMGVAYDPAFDGDGLRARRGAITCATGGKRAGLVIARDLLEF
jgi:alkylation response protein AidB-like acyl-CoA dehydrogenase